MKNLYIFDCFNVIVEEIAPRFFGKYFSPDEAKVRKEQYFHDIDLGKMTLDEFYSNIEKDFGIPATNAKEYWTKTPSLNREILPILKKLREKGDVVLLSNAPKGYVESLFQELGISSYFKKIYTSSSLDMAKPDPRVYEYVISDLHEVYENVFMIDDNPKNLEPLPSLGIKGILFQGNNSLLPLFLL